MSHFFVLLFEKLFLFLFKSDIGKQILLIIIIGVFVLWVIGKIFKLIAFIFRLFTPEKPKEQPVIKINPRPAPKISAPVEREPDDLRMGIDRAFEDLGLNIRFGHFNKGAQNMLKKAWGSRRSPVRIAENVRPEGKDLEPSFDHQLARESASERAIPAHNTLHITHFTSVQQWVVFNEILSPPLALREE